MSRSLGSEYLLEVTHRMEPVAIVTAFVAALYIVGRGPLLVAPAATAAFYRRLLSTPGRVRIFGCLLIPLAAALVVTARQARAAQADAAAKSEDKGGAWAGAVDVAPGIKLYQLTKYDLALQATIQGTKFWKDDELS